MRVSKEVMAKNNGKIIESAAYLFRTKGIDGTSVSDVMEAAGLTHGGFYRHFDSKEELLNESINKAFNHITTNLRENIDNLGAKKAIVNYVDKYLSMGHVETPGIGCPMAALGSEAKQNSSQFKENLTKGKKEVVNLIMEGLSGSSREKKNKALALISLLVGTIILARSTEDLTERQDLLKLVKVKSRDYIS